MKRRWYTTLVLIICILLPLLASCKQELINSTTSSSGEDETINPTTPSGGEDETINSTTHSSGGTKAAKDIAEEVMGYLKSRDVESLKAMFCEELKNRDDFDEKIDDVMNLLDGEIISYRNISGSGKQGDTWEALEPELIEIETDTGKEKRYSIFMSVYIKNEDPDKLGVYAFQFYTHSGTLDDEDRTILNSKTLEIQTIIW